MRYSCKFFAVLSFGLLLTACNPGYEMEPVGLQKLWSKGCCGFELQTGKIQGLTGEWWVSPELKIITEDKPVTIESAELQTPKGTYPFTIKSEKIIPPFSARKIYIDWGSEDKTPAPNILGDSSQIIFHLKVGDKEQTVEIEYDRKR